MRTCLYNILAILLLVGWCNTTTYAQVPQGINYQGVATNTKGEAVANQDIVIEITLYKDDPVSGTLVWQETHPKKTNEFGYFSIVIGQGTSTGSGSLKNFGIIDWATGKYYIRTRVDFGASSVGNGLMDMGTVQLLSVPYALMANDATFADSARAAGWATTAGRALIADSARNAGGTAKSYKLDDLTDVNVPLPTSNQVLMWNGTQWTAGSVSVSSTDYLRKDGTTDLTGNWNISNNNISMGLGTLALEFGDISMMQGSINLTNGSIKLNSGNLTVTSGTLTAFNLKLAQGTDVNNISTDVTLGGVGTGSDDALATQKAIKAYVDSKVMGGGGTSDWTLVNTNLYPKDLANNVGIGTVPSEKFHVHLTSDEGFLVSGTTGAGNIPNWGAGTRMYFYPIKSAFRAGEVTSTAWDDANVGKYTIAMGKDTKASGQYGIALGNGSESAGTTAFSAGNLNKASGVSSVAMGEKNEANGYAASAFGNSNFANADASFAIGLSNKTSGKNSFVGGTLSEASAINSIAFGNNAKMMANAQGSFSLGNGTFTMGEYSAAMGVNLTAFSVGEFVVGMNSTNYSIGPSSVNTWLATDRIFAIGNGKSSAFADRSNAMTVWKGGQVAIGSSTQPSGTVKLAVSGDVTANGTTLTSDLRYKTDIANIDNALDKILSMNGVYYNWRTNEFPNKGFSTGRQLGVIAQQIEPIVPELVITDNDGYKTVDYIKITAILIEALKEQQQIIDSQNKKIDGLQNDVNQIKALIGSSVSPTNK